MRAHSDTHKAAAQRPTDTHKAAAQRPMPSSSAVPVPRAPRHAHRAQAWRRGLAAAALASLAPVLASCATGFDAPTRHARANLQAAATTVGTDLLVQDVIVALPNGTTAAAGSDAYLQFSAVNLSGQPNSVTRAAANLVPTAGAGADSASSDASPQPAAKNLIPVGTVDIPAKGGASPGTQRIVIALQQLTKSLSQGDYLSVSLNFSGAGSVQNLLVPVEGADAVSSAFLPTAPPSALVSSSAASSPPSTVPTGQASGPAGTIASPAESAAAWPRPRRSWMG